MPNIFDVAAAAGVSKTTVSKVLNNQYGVNEDTRKRVLEAVKKLNYIPNQAAKNLVTSKSGVIGVIFNTSFKVPIYTELSFYLQKYAESMGYNLVFCNYNGREEIKAKYVSYFMGGAADGIIFFGSDTDDKGLIESIKASSYPLVVIENYFDDLEINNILIDNVNGSKNVVKYLASLGHRRIAYVTGCIEQRVASDRFNGYMRALQENSITFNPEYVFYTDYCENSTRVALNKLLSLKVPPTAIYLFNDIMAYEAIWDLSRRGYNVPEDFSIVGFDNFAATFDFFKSSIELTSVEQPMEKVSKASIELLVQNINNKKMEFKQLIFETTLVKGTSCRTI